MDVREAFAVSLLLHGANETTLEQLAGQASVIRVERGAQLFSDAEAMQTVYIVAEGIAFLEKYGEDGNRRVVFLCGQGETLNEEAVSAGFSSAACGILQDALILCFPIPVVLRAMEQDVVLAKAMMDSMARKIRRMYHQLKNTSHSLRGDRRVAAKLWKLSRDFGITTQEGTRIDFDLSITFLADMLGSTRETVSRQLKLLSADGLVCCKEGIFLIPDRDALREYYKKP